MNMIIKVPSRSAWQKGVAKYVEELIEEYNNICEYEGHEAETKEELKKMILNGASNWKQYSEGGCSLCYDADIANRLCAPWELKKTNHGMYAPNKYETWLDVQARALSQAFNLALQNWLEETL